MDSVSVVWRHFLEDRPFVVHSDHCALTRKLAKSAHDPPISACQARWIERLMPFPLTFQHIPSNENIVADALSRYPSPQLNNVTVISPLLFQYLHLLQSAAKEGYYVSTLGLSVGSWRACCNFWYSTLDRIFRPEVQ